MDLLKVLAVPFQPGSLLFVAASSLLLGLVLGSGNFVTALMGLWATLIILVWLTRYAFHMIDDIANGVREAAAADVELANPVGDTRYLVHPGLAVALGVLHLRYPTLSAAPTLILAALFFPPSIAASAMSGRARDALNPISVARVIAGFGPWYAVAVLAAAGCAALGVVLARMLEPGWLLFASLELLLLVAYAAIGGVVYHRRIELGFAARISPERRAEVQENARHAERQRLLDQVFGQLRGHDAPRAVADVAQWLRQAATHDLHGDVQAILVAGKAWNEPFEFARLLQGLLPVLLQLRQPALAFSVVEAGLGAHPAFTPADETTAVALIEYGMQTSRRRTATRLLQNFLARPGSAVAPESRLAALREALQPALPASQPAS